MRLLREAPRPPRPRLPPSTRCSRALPTKHMAQSSCRDSRPQAPRFTVPA